MGRTRPLPKEVQSLRFVPDHSFVPARGCLGTAQRRSRLLFAQTKESSMGDGKRAPPPQDDKAQNPDPKQTDEQRRKQQQQNEQK